MLVLICIVEGIIFLMLIKLGMTAEHAIYAIEAVLCLMLIYVFYMHYRDVKSNKTGFINENLGYIAGYLFVAIFLVPIMLVLFGLNLFFIVIIILSILLTWVSSIK